MYVYIDRKIYIFRRKTEKNNKFVRQYTKSAN